MNVLKKIKVSKISTRINKISKIIFIFSLFTLVYSFFQKSEVDYENRMIKENIVIIKKQKNSYKIEILAAKSRKDIQHADRYTNYLNGSVKKLEESEEKFEKNKKQKEKIDTLFKYNTIFSILMLLILIISAKTKKIDLTKNNHLELLKLDNNYEKEFIKYMKNLQIENILSDIEYLKEAQSLISKKDWLLERIKESQNFKKLLSKNEFEEYLSLFEKDFINHYFKEEIEKFKKENELIYNISKEKEKIKIISM